MQLLADARSGYFTSEAMRKKSGAATSILRAIAILKIMYGRPIDRLHTDVLKEQQLTPFQEFMDKMA